MLPVAYAPCLIMALLAQSAAVSESARDARARMHDRY